MYVPRVRTLTTCSSSLGKLAVLEKKADGSMSPKPMVNIPHPESSFWPADDAHRVEPSLGSQGNPLEAGSSTIAAYAHSVARLTVTRIGPAAQWYRRVRTPLIRLYRNRELRAQYLQLAERVHVCHEL